MKSASALMSAAKHKKTQSFAVLNGERGIRNTNLAVHKEGSVKCCFKTVDRSFESVAVVGTDVRKKNLSLRLLSQRSF
jgi:hypothetical protein